MKVAVLWVAASKRSRTICNAVAKGILKCGENVALINEGTFRFDADYDVAVFYGLQGCLKKVLAQYPKEGRKAVYIDLGYWGRREGGVLAGYHKLVVNDRHPNAYFQNRAHDRARFARFKLRPEPYRRDSTHILLAGMGDKAARAAGHNPEAWEKAAIRAIRAETDLPIVYRPKPSWHAAKPLEGTVYSPASDALEPLFARCHAVVSHHSNVTVDGLVKGVPAFVWEGVAVPMGLQDLAKINEPLLPEGREQWLNDIAYCQWNVAEMEDGSAWRYLKDEGLVQ